jgi:hypothetical protein
MRRRSVQERRAVEGNGPVSEPGPVGSDEFRKSLGLTGLLLAVKGFLEITPTEVGPRCKSEIGMIIPGDWGKIRSGWLAWSLTLAERKFRELRQYSPVPLAMFAHCQ